nr:hypothetical protein [Solanum melongena]WMB97121.1 hypothetical protein [Solanum aethiopicum]
MARLAVGEALTNLVWAKVTSLSDVKASGNWMYAAKLDGEGAAIYDAALALSEAMIELGIAIDGGKDSLSMAAHASGDSIYLLLYVDDLFLTGSDQQGILALLSFLHAHENMKDLGLLHDFLGMEVYRQGRTLILRQQKYALDLLPRADMLDSRPLATPLTSGTELPKLDVTSLSDPTYFILLLSRLTVTISYTPRTRIKILPLGPPFTFC